MLVLFSYLRELAYILVLRIFKPSSFLGLLQICSIRMGALNPNLRDYALKLSTSKKFFDTFNNWPGISEVEIDDSLKSNLSSFIQEICQGQYKDVSTTKRVYIVEDYLKKKFSTLVNDIFYTILAQHDLSSILNYKPKISIVAFHNLPNTDNQNLSTDALVPHRDLDYPCAMKLMFEFDKNFNLKIPETKVYGDRKAPYIHKIFKRGDNPFIKEINPIKKKDPVGLIFDSFSLHSGPQKIVQKRVVLQLMISVGDYYIKDLSYVD